MSEDVTKKIETLMKTNFDPTEEKDVVYLFVEIRKIIESDVRKLKLPILKFYCDWVVHTSKDRVNKEMKCIIVEMYKNIEDEAQNPYPIFMSLNDFMYMGELFKEITTFFKKYKLPKKELIVQWGEILATLICILSEHPINSPIPEIRFINIVKADRGKAICIVYLTKPIKGNTHVTYMNVL